MTRCSSCDFPLVSTLADLYYDDPKNEDLDDDDLDIGKRFSDREGPYFCCRTCAENYVGDDDEEFWDSEEE